MDKAKEANKAEVNKLTQEGVQEIKHISDLSPEEQAQFNHQLKDLESKVYNMIKNAKNLTNSNAFSKISKRNAITSLHKLIYSVKNIKLNVDSITLLIIELNKLLMICQQVNTKDNWQSIVLDK